MSGSSHFNIRHLKLRHLSSDELPGLPQQRVPTCGLRIPGDPATVSGFPWDSPRLIQKGKSTVQGFRFTLKGAASVLKCVWGIYGHQQRGEMMICPMGDRVVFDSSLTMGWLVFWRSFCLSHLVGGEAWTVSSGGHLWRKSEPRWCGSHLQTEDEGNAYKCLNQAITEFKWPSQLVKYANNAMISCAYKETKLRQVPQLNWVLRKGWGKERKHVQKGTFCIKDAVE